MKLSCFILFLTTAVLFVSLMNPSFADSESLQAMKNEIQALKDRIALLEQKLEQESKTTKTQPQAVVAETAAGPIVYGPFEESYDSALYTEQEKISLQKEGFKIGIHSTIIGQGTNNANLEGSSNKDKFEGSFRADVEIEKEFPSLNSKAYINIRKSQGLGIDRVLALYSPANNNKQINQNFFVTSLFYEQFLFANKVLINIGKLDTTMFFDQNRVAGNDGTKFLGSIFNNNPAIEFPTQNIGVRLGWALVKWLELNYLVVNGNADLEDIDDHLFNIFQATFKPDFFEKKGYYRFIAWYNNNRHIKWSNPNGRRGTYGFALSFDQDLTDNLTLFTRYGWEDPEVYNPEITASGNNILSLEQSWSAGGQLTGSIWGRENDVLGLAVGQVIPSGDYKKALNRNAKHEGRIELFYNVQFNEHLSFSPTLQYIWNPYGKDIADNKDNVLVYSIRTHIDF